MKGHSMRFQLALACALLGIATAAEAQTARTNFVAPRILTADTPRFQRLGSEQTLCVRKEKIRKRVASTKPDELIPCKTSE
jgi:hypothetical protein